jgi:hypothetical protein
VGAVHDETVDDVLFGEVGNRLIDSEHIFAERAAIADMTYGLPADYEFVAGTKETEILAISLVSVEEKAVVRLGPGHDGEIFDIFAYVAVEANVVVHHDRPLLGSAQYYRNVTLIPSRNQTITLLASSGAPQRTVQVRLRRPFLAA